MMDRGLPLGTRRHDGQIRAWRLRVRDVGVDGGEVGERVVGGGGAVCGWVAFAAVEALAVAVEGCVAHVCVVVAD